MQMRSKKNIGKKGTKKNSTRKNSTRKISTRKNIGKKSYKNRTRKNYSKKKKGGASETKNDTDTFGLKAFIDQGLNAAFEIQSENHTLREVHDSIKETAQSKLISIINSLSRSEVTKDFFHIDQWKNEDVKINEVVNIYTMLLYALAIAISHKTKYTDVDLLNFIYDHIYKSYLKDFKSLEKKLEELRILMGEEATSPSTHSFGK